MEMRRLAVSVVPVVVLTMALFPPSAVADGGWMEAHATFYGDESGAETMQGACGYGDLFQQGYGLDTTALSVALFSDGWACGGCYEIQCHDNPDCKPDPVTVTATNLCPANYSKPNENWCNPPLKHFDLSKPVFLRLADFRVGIIPVQYRRVPCAKKGGVRVEMTGNQFWIGVLVFNVAGSGEVKALAVKGSEDGQWRAMKRNWGQIWDGDVHKLVGQALSFYIVTTDGRAVVLDSVVPTTWAIGQSFEGKGQF
ncbi:unnamed protein product [Alopecurus aequalis]